jgi:hypothetical protein
MVEDIAVTCILFESVSRECSVVIMRDPTNL